MGHLNRLNRSAARSGLDVIMPLPAGCVPKRKSSSSSSITISALNEGSDLRPRALGRLLGIPRGWKTGIEREVANGGDGDGVIVD